MSALLRARMSCAMDSAHQHSERHALDTASTATRLKSGSRMRRPSFAAASVGTAEGSSLTRRCARPAPCSLSIACADFQSVGASSSTQTAMTTSLTVGGGSTYERTSAMSASSSPPTARTARVYCACAASTSASTSTCTDVTAARVSATRASCAAISAPIFSVNSPTADSLASTASISRCFASMSARTLAATAACAAAADPPSRSLARAAVRLACRARSALRAAPCRRPSSVTASCSFAAGSTGGRGRAASADAGAAAAAATSGHPAIIPCSQSTRDACACTASSSWHTELVSASCVEGAGGAAGGTAGDPAAPPPCCCCCGGGGGGGGTGSSTSLGRPSNCAATLDSWSAVAGSATDTTASAAARAGKRVRSRAAAAGASTSATRTRPNSSAAAAAAAASRCAAAARADCSCACSAARPASSTSVSNPVSMFAVPAAPVAASRSPLRSDCSQSTARTCSELCCMYSGPRSVATACSRPPTLPGNPPRKPGSPLIDSSFPLPGAASKLSPPGSRPPPLGSRLPLGQRRELALPTDVMASSAMVSRRSAVARCERLRADGLSPSKPASSGAAAGDTSSSCKGKRKAA
eukprot:355166-Chlamydomonas_euryale.AAC.8